MTYRTIRFHATGPVGHLQFDRPEAGNTINRAMIEECHDAIDACLAANLSVLVLKGSADVFCAGADFEELARLGDDEDQGEAEHL